MRDKDKGGKTPDLSDGVTDHHDGSPVGLQQQLARRLLQLRSKFDVDRPNILAAGALCK